MHIWNPLSCCNQVSPPKDKLLYETQRLDVPLSVLSSLLAIVIITSLYYRLIYEDSSVKPIPLDLHSACANGHYDLVKESIEKKDELNLRNKGQCTTIPNK